MWSKCLGCFSFYKVKEERTYTYIHIYKYISIYIYGGSRFLVLKGVETGSRPVGYVVLLWSFGYHVKSSRKHLILKSICDEQVYL
ncbi:hypothetical protein L1887_08949 [Cichorium endivia]|nr:hypothetical protein L1887_08949 [Cichorium endivia]